MFTKAGFSPVGPFGPINLLMRRLVEGE